MIKPKSYTRLFVSALLATAVGIANAADATESPAAAQSAPVTLGDYTTVGFLSDYSKLKPEGDDSRAYAFVPVHDGDSKYNKVMIDRIKIFFADDADYKGIDPTDLKALADYFHDAITKSLGDAYPVVTEPGPDVIRLRIAVTNVTPNKPEASVVTLAVPFLWVADAGSGVASGNTGSSAFVGKASVEGEALDSVTSEQVAAYVGTEIPKKYNWTEGVVQGVGDYTKAYSTWAYTKQAMDMWAKYVREKMDEVHGK